VVFEARSFVAIRPLLRMTEGRGSDTTSQPQQGASALLGPRPGVSDRLALVQSGRTVTMSLPQGGVRGRDTAALHEDKVTRGVGPCHRTKLAGSHGALQSVERLGEAAVLFHILA
jgi:hypothetical protein